MSLKKEHKYDAIVIGGSAGSFPIVSEILSQLPSNFNLPIFMALHRLKQVRHGFLEALAVKSSVELVEPLDKQVIKKGIAYLAPANYHMCIELGKTISLSTEPLVNNSRPAIDLTFSTASYVYKQKLIAILLSGANKDGADGINDVKIRGGLTIVQDPKDCVIDTMSLAAIESTTIDKVLTSKEIINFLKTL